MMSFVYLLPLLGTEDCAESSREPPFDFGYLYSAFWVFSF